MHYYKFHIGDYRKDTGHLSTLEHGIYRQLIDWYYLDEKPIPLETHSVIRRLRLGLESDYKALENVLSDFFDEEEDGYHHKRIDSEIKEYSVLRDKNQLNGKLGGRPKKTQSVISGLPYGTQDEPRHIPNHKPLTINQEPDNTLSPLQAKPDPVNRLNGKSQMVAEVMAYLNLQARRNYRVSNPNGTPTAGALVIAQRLKEGYTVDQCKDVIGVKSNAWMGDEKMDQYLNPQTLFRKSNFDKYLTEAEAAQ